jgi:hypothetical protein
MAYTATTLFKVGGANPGLWIYHSTDALSAIVASGYFNTSTNSLKQNDVILAVGATGGTRTVDMLVVSSATHAAVVTVINGTA